MDQQQKMLCKAEKHNTHVLYIGDSSTKPVCKRGYSCTSPNRAYLTELNLSTLYNYTPPPQ